MSNTDTIFASHPFGSEITETALIKTFRTLKQWEDRYRELMILSKRLPMLPDELKTIENALLIGCENRVWFGYQKLLDGTIHFYGDSEGRIVRGLLAVFLTIVEGKTPKQLSTLKPLTFFHDLHLINQLSTIRSSVLITLAAKAHKISICYL